MHNIIVVTFRDGKDIVAVITMEGPVLDGTVLSKGQEAAIVQRACTFLAADWNQQAVDVGEPEAAVFVPATCALGLSTEIFLTTLHPLVS